MGRFIGKCSVSIVRGSTVHLGHLWPIGVLIRGVTVCTSNMQVIMDEHRYADRYQEIAARRQLELEHTRREQELARRMQEVRERETR